MNFSLLGALYAQRQEDQRILANTTRMTQRNYQSSLLTTTFLLFTGGKAATP